MRSSSKTRSRRSRSSGALASLAFVLLAAACDDAATGDGRDGGATAFDASSWGARCDPRPGGDETIEGRRRYLGFEIDGRGFDEHEGQVIRAVTYRWDEPERVLAAEEAVVVDGAFRFAWPNAYERFSYQPAFFYADVDADGRCDPDVDHVWGGPSSAWNPRDDEPYVEEIAHEVNLGAHLSGDRARAACDRLDGC